MLDCVVIGAGLAGLTAARDLLDREHTVLVLEARGRVGGRVENLDLADGQYVELGGQWLADGNDSILELVRRHGLAVVADDGRGSFRMRLRGRTQSLPSPRDAAELTPFELADLGSGLLRLRRLGQRLRDDPAWAAANHVWLGQPLERWLGTNLRTAGARDRFGRVYRTAFGPLEPDTTLQDGLRHVNEGPNLESMLASNGRLSQVRIAGGAFTLAQAMADELGPAVRLGSPVIRVIRSDDAASVVLADGATIRARRVIIALPPRLAVGLEHEPALPDWRLETAARVAPGTVIKACLVYERPFWREEGFSGQSSSDEGPVRVTFDTTTAEGGRGLLMGYFEGADADSLSRRSISLRQRAFTEAAVRMFGDRAAQPLQYAERDWAAEPFTGGCHGAHFAPGLWTTVGPALAEAEGVLHFAGAEYSARSNGYMEGAVRSGHEAAAAVVLSLV